MRVALQLVLLGAFLANSPQSAPSQDDGEEPQLVIDLGGHDSTVRDILFLPDGKRVISLGMDKTARIWDATSGDLLKTLRRERGDDYAGILYAGAISSDGRYLAVGGRDLSIHAGGEASVRIIDLEEDLIVAVLQSHASTITKIAFSPNDEFLASGSADGQVRLWRTGPLAEPRLIEKSKVLEGHAGQITTLAFTEDGSRLLSSSASPRQNLILWDTSALGGNVDDATIEGIQCAPTPLEKHENLVYAADITPGGEWIVSGDEDGNVYVWEGATGTFTQKIANTAPVSAVKCAPDASRVFISSLRVGPDGSDDGEAAIYSLNNPAQKLATLPVTGSNRLTAYDWCDTAVAIAFADGASNRIQVWRDDGSERVTTMESQGRSVTDVAFGVNDESIEVAFGLLPDGVANLDHRGLTHVFDFSELVLRPVQDDDRFRHSFREDQKEATVRSGSGGNQLTLPDGSQFEVAAPNVVRDWAVTEGGNLVVGHDAGLTVRSSNGEERLLTGHTAPVRRVSPSPGEKYVVSGSEDRTIRLWDLETGNLLVSLFVADPNNDEWVCWAPNGYFAASRDGGKYFGWHFNKGPDRLASFLPADQLFDHYNRPDIIKKSIIDRKPADEIVQLLELEELDLKKAEAEVPEVQFVNLESEGQATTKLQLFQVQSTVKSGNPPEIRVFHQGKRVNADGGGTIRGDDQAFVMPYQLELVSGANEIKAVAVNADGVESPPAVVVLNYEGEVATAKIFILSVGLNEYYNEIYRLGYCRADAEEVASRLVRNSEGLFVEAPVVEIYDAKATKPAVMGALDQISKIARKEDVFVFFYAGHGVMGSRPGSSEELFHLILHDVPQMYGDPEGLEEKAISAPELKQYFDKIQAYKQLWILDACQSGGFLETQKFAMRGAHVQHAISRLARSTGLAICTATASDRFAREATELQHGILSFSVIQALDGAAAVNGMITVDSLKGYLQREVPKISKQHTDLRQVPFFSYMGTDFPIGVVQ